MTNNMKSTKDIYLAASWLALGAKYERTDKSDERHMEFFFSPKPLFETGVLSSHTETNVVMGTPVTVTYTSPSSQDLDQIETDWGNGCVMVNAVKYKDALQRLKAIIHSK